MLVWTSTLIFFGRIPVTKNLTQQCRFGVQIPQTRPDLQWTKYRWSFGVVGHGPHKISNIIHLTIENWPILKKNWFGWVKIEKEVWLKNKPYTGGTAKTETSSGAEPGLTAVAFCVLAGTYFSFRASTFDGSPSPLSPTQPKLSLCVALSFAATWENSKSKINCWHPEVTTKKSGTALPFSSYPPSSLASFLPFFLLSFFWTFHHNPNQGLLWTKSRNVISDQARDTASFHFRIQTQLLICCLK